MISDGSDDKRAPDHLFLVQRFVNSVDLEDQEEELTSVEALRDWFAQRDLMGADEKLCEGDLRRALDVREGLRALLLANNGHDLDQAAVDRMNRAAARAGLVLVARDGTPGLEPETTGIDGALARVLAVVATSVADGTWARLKACLHDDCLWAFYDHSRNRSGKWCSMDTCGNVHKARTYRARRRGAAAAS